MANIKLTLPGEPFTKQLVTFTAPCDCSAVSNGLFINNDVYTVCNALGECVTGKGGVWAKGAQVSVVLDCEKKKAYLQNGNATPSLIGAASAVQHEVPHYRATNSLSDIGIDASTLGSGAEDLITSLKLIYEAMAAKEQDSEYWLTLGTSQPLQKSIIAKINADLNASVSASIVVRLVKRSYIMEVRVMLQSWIVHDKEYSCVYRYATDRDPVLTPFSVTRESGGFVSNSGGNLTGGALGLADGKVRWINNGNGYLQLSHYTTAGDNSNAAHILMAHPKHSTQGGLDKVLRLGYRKDGGTEQYYPILHTGNLETLGCGRIVTGSYVGTGTYGVNNPNRIVFDGVPKYVCISGASDEVYDTQGNSDRYRHHLIWHTGMDFMIDSFKKSRGEMWATLSGNTLSWYDGYDECDQLNAANEVYNWFAIY